MNSIKTMYKSLLVFQIVFYSLMAVGSVFLHAHDLHINSTEEIKQSAGTICFYAHQGSNQIGVKPVQVTAMTYVTEDVIQFNREYFETETVGFSSNRAPPLA